MTIVFSYENSSTHVTVVSSESKGFRQTAQIDAASKSRIDFNPTQRCEPMYTPEDFKEYDSERLEALIKDYPFGMLVTTHHGLPFVSHIPFLYERRKSNVAVLLGHVAKANPQWHHLATGQTALVVFQGPHAYISPSWYSSPDVPTWNYAVAHIYGLPRIFENKDDLVSLVDRLTVIHETAQPKPWKGNLSEEYRSKLLDMIVGFEIPIEKIEGKFKLNQNRSIEDQRSVAQHLEESGAPLSFAVAKLMKHNLRKKC